VDDASGMRTYLRLILESAGFVCTEASDGGEAFDKILKGGFDIVITDLEMPSMDGYQLLSAISLLPVSKGRPPVIVASAMMDENLAQRRPELRQASVLLAKPVQPADLLKAVEKVLAARSVSR
jgi:CheY-like chemotaxis protein